MQQTKTGGGRSKVGKRFILFFSFLLLSFAGGGTSKTVWRRGEKRRKKIESMGFHKKIDFFDVHEKVAQIRKDRKTLLMKHW